MFPLIALAAISVASSIAGGISANKKQRKADQILSDRERNLKEWYNSEMNMPYLDRADSRAMLKRIRDYNEDQLGKAAGTQNMISGIGSSLGQLAMLYGMGSGSGGGLANFAGGK